MEPHIAETADDDFENMDMEAAIFDQEINLIHRVCCIGAGRTGVFCMLVLAHHWPQIQFHIVDSNEGLINRWMGNELPFHEPGLYHRLLERRGVNLFFGLNIAQQVGLARVIFITVDALTKQKGVGKKGRLDLTDWEKAIRSIGASAVAGPKLIVEKSTMAVEFSNKIVEILAEYGAVHNFQVLSNPEFFSQGTAFLNLEEPDQVVIASKTNGGAGLLRQFYGWVANERIRILNDPKSAELGKVACNAYLGMKATLMHCMTLMIDRSGGDVNDVCTIVGGDRRINPMFIEPGVSFGGSDLNKDIAYLAYLADFYNLPDVSKHFKSVLATNRKIKEVFVAKILEMMVSLRGKNFAVYGFSFKRGTDDIRNSPSLYICQRLLKEGALVRVFDPIVQGERIVNCFSRNATLTVAATMEEAWQNADAVCFLVDWPEFRQMLIGSATQMFNEMRRPAFFIDGCNAGYEYGDLSFLGFRLYVPGRPHLSLP